MRIQCSRPRWFYLWLVPLVWVLTSWAAAYYPGDEYGLWAGGSLAGIWIFALVEDRGNIWDLLPIVLGTGAATMAGIGLLLDLLRPRLRVLLVVYLVVAAVHCGWTLASYPSYERAIAKNGSLQAYALIALNHALYVTCFGALLVTGLIRLFRRRPRAGYCPDCGYNLTGNVSGRCPECGERVEHAQ